MRQINWTLVVIAVLVSGLSARAEDEQDKDIRRLLELTGGGQLGVQVVSQMVETFKQSIKAPDGFWEDFMKEVNPNDIVNLAVPIYRRYLEPGDVKDLIRLYETPAARKFVKVQPQILRESQEAGSRWGQQLVEKVMRKLEAAQKNDPGSPKGKK
jgi:hypothetical protein